MTYKHALLLLALACAAQAQRTTVPLDGEWDIEDSIAADSAPTAWSHRAPVPGMANLARPAFPNVDQFDSKEVIANRVRQGRLPASALVQSSQGIPRQERNYFWYRRTFTAPARKQLAILRVNKAQFGTAVWLNGRKIGEHLNCFAAGIFDLTPAVNWTGPNELTIRIGAHPAVIPEDIPVGTDFEKNRWTPGIYDSVSLILSDSLFIDSVQVAPRIQSSEAVIQTRVRNSSARPVAFNLEHRITSWKDGQEAARSTPRRIELAPGESKAVTETVAIPNARLWSPEHPFLYVLETTTGGDSLSTRFGMREFRFDTTTKRAYLNGKPYFLRGSNITLHRFFEDPLAGGLPWNEAWVRKLLAEIPKKMNWNSFRFCIGPAPDKWLDIADETGLLIQNEYFIWTGHPSWGGGYERKWNAAELTRQYEEWMRDNWNHPSVVIWDANNESADPIFEQVVPKVRGLDLSNRPWENSYNVPLGPDDPVEDHPDLFQRGVGGKPFQMTELEGMFGAGRAGYTPSGHAQILNEYGWLWLLRDGTPTELTGKVYEALLGAKARGEDRLALDAYLLGGLTEFWRAYRNYAGVLHFVYLTSCYPGAYTCDHFRNVQKLELEPHFADYVREAFKPLGVYINFWQPSLKAGSSHRFIAMMVNDDYENAGGKLVLSLEREDGKTVARAEQPFSIPGLGQQTYAFEDFRIPEAHGDFILKAAAYRTGNAEPTLSRRKLRIE